MPTISEKELSGDVEVTPCTECGQFEGAIWLCGEGYICEKCFADLSGMPEEDLFLPKRPLLDFELPAGAKAKAKAKLMKKRGNVG